jgi:putative salt-induced outer membrane protein
MSMKRTTQLSISIVVAALGAGSAPAQTNGTPPPPQWQSSASLGLTLTRGNSDTTTISATAATEKKWDQNELSFGADGLYGTTKLPGSSSSTKNAEQLHGFAQYNRLFTERFYGYARVDGLHDGIADIKYRLTVSPGVGYYFIKEKTIDLSGEVGPGFVDEHLDNQYKDYATIRVAEKFHYAISDRARLWQTAEWLPQVDYVKNYIINFEIGIEADVTKDKRLTLKTYLDDTYNNVPAAGRKKNDAKLVAAIGYKF